MPIRINLLAEAQAAEDLRRRDPVKRAIYVAVCIVVGVLVWVSSLQVKIMADNSQLSNLQGRMATHTNDYNRVLKNEAQLTEVNNKLTALNQLAAERFLQSTLLDSLMHATVEGIQITRMRTDQNFDNVAEVKSVVTGGKLIPGHPAGVDEHIKLIIDAKDSSADPGNEQIKVFRETLANTPYFKAENISTNNILLKSFSTPQLDGETGKAYVLFSLECLYPDHVH